jgi:GTP pyrophosphokinase
VKFSKCCTPVPGDPVVGFITRGYGVSVHRADCPNADPARRKPEEEGRWIRVSWAQGDQGTYKTSLEVSAKDRDGLALDAASTLSAVKVRVESFSARSMPDGFAIINIVLQVRDRSELNTVINKLNTIPGVMTVQRAKG